MDLDCMEPERSGAATLSIASIDYEEVDLGFNPWTKLEFEQAQSASQQEGLDLDAKYRIPDLPQVEIFEPTRKGAIKAENTNVLPEPLKFDPERRMAQVANHGPKLPTIDW